MWNFKDYVMKRVVSSILVLFLSISLFAQEVLDNAAFYRAEYIHLYKKDSLKTTFFKDVFYLDICKSGHSLFYSRANQIKDSVETALKADGISGLELVMRTRQLSNGLQWYIDKRFADCEYDYTNKLLVDFKRYTAPLEMPQWEIVGDTVTINGFLCKEAHAFVQGRKWIAWYTEEIQSNDGPWLLWGLPGLIIHAKDSDNYFKFNCTSVKLLDEPYTVLLPGSNNLITEITKKEMLEQETLKETDPVAFMGSMDGVVKVVTDTRVGEKKYIPLISSNVVNARKKH